MTEKLADWLFPPGTYHRDVSLVNYDCCSTVRAFEVRTLGDFISVLTQEPVTGITPTLGAEVFVLNLR